ncbi:amidohydrolase family protein [Flavobacterium sp. ANB]|uniref:amidohydrolase family protein n=1 Tax=unclassified Flavobacterium TaxID=196869 RepID=UPI0012B7585C|nr:MULTISPECIES: amidohydrolase family protein [unclassified Flavobacterium]MBF4517822.1 amidohydrolase family protein [Flavobacterium sp. ANB]MTD70549.1 amidohydrolase family protein [Flavobacterium sp. LC2016-13]
MNNRIDAHQHFWKFDPVRDSWIDDSMQKIQRDFLPEDLLPLLHENQFSGCVAVQASQSEEETNFLVNLAAKNDFIKGVVGWVDLRDVIIEERLKHFSSNKILKGFRHVVQGEADDFMLRKDFQNGISLLKQFNYTYDILIFHHQLPAAINLVNQFTDQPFVIDHIAKPDIKSGDILSWKKGIEEISKAENVMCKISGMVTEANWHSWKTDDLKPYLDVIFENFSVDKLMFGSDWPVLNVASDYTDVVKTLENYIAQFSIQDQNKIWSENAKLFYKL